MSWTVRCKYAFAVAGLVACSASVDRSDPWSGPDVFPTDGGEASACWEQRRCSRDLHQVLDGCNTLVETCGDNLGCSKGACVAACDSAAATQGTIGCSFWTTAPDSLRDSETSCFAAFIANTWDKPVDISAELGSEPLDISKSVYRARPNGPGSLAYEPIVGAIPPGEVGIVFLSEGDPTPETTGHIACPPGVTSAHRGVLTPEHATSIYKAFHISSTVPVSAYSIFPYGGADSQIPASTLLTPSTSWDTSYLLVDAWRYPHSLSSGYPFVQIVAQEDTEVRLRPKVPVADGVGIAGGPKGSMLTWNLKRGEVLELSQSESLAGSALEATHPVALFGGNQCTNVPEDFTACDALHQQIPPVHQWSSTYSAVPYASRRIPITAGDTPAAESVTWQLVAANDDTVLTYDPAPPVGAPLAIGAGERTFFATDKLFSVKSQDTNHPIYLAVYMSGGNQYVTLGDPDFVNVIPNDQFLDHYVFFVDHTYADSTLTLVRRKDASGFRDVTLDCAGVISNWQPLGTDGTTEYAWVSVTHGGLDVETAVGACSYGRHEAASDGPFALYVWGMDTWASYGFPAGSGSRPTSPYTVKVN